MLNYLAGLTVLLGLLLIVAGWKGRIPGVKTDADEFLHYGIILTIAGITIGGVA